MKYLITGAKGFIGRNLVAHLQGEEDVQLLQYDLDNSEKELNTWLRECDGVFHLAGVNRPKEESEFEAGNASFTGEICNKLQKLGKHPPIIMTSSIQAERDNPYGSSKRHAEMNLADYAGRENAPVAIYRLKNVFGKWCRPNYNSVVATFCHNIANDLPVQISDPAHELELVHIDDVVAALINTMQNLVDGNEINVDANRIVADNIPFHIITLGDLAGRIQFFRDMQETLKVPDFSMRFNQQLYGTYLSYLPSERWKYILQVRSDDRGNLAEFVKSPHFGQIFVSRTRPGITRGNHYHHTKTEKFLVIQGEGLIRFRHIQGDEVIDIPVKGKNYEPVEIPPGYTHSITNTGDDEMITLFWASEVFDPDHPDTFYMNVEG